ncbi:MAG: hypothetical protein ACOYYF_05315 [Chloroflexota bacterium]|nr:hypothetical protein [Chloroflexota bacterium]MBI5702722.1 hypothetical protein [Chloroflexota bacterium]
MAGKKFKNKPQRKEIDPTVRSARMMRVIFIILSLMIVLSMVLAAVASFY